MKLAPHIPGDAYHPAPWWETIMAGSKPVPFDAWKFFGLCLFAIQLQEAQRLAGEAFERSLRARLLVPLRREGG